MIQLTRFRRYGEVGVVLALTIVMLAIVGILRPGFASPGNLRNLAVAAAILGLVAAGQTLVILIGGIDLSIPWVLNGAAVLTTLLAADSDGPLIWVLPLVLVLGLMVGLFNGLGVAYLRISPIIMTLATNSMLAGGLLAYTQGRSGGHAPSRVSFMAQGNVAGVPIILIIWLTVAILLTIVLSRSVLGRRLYALGNSPLVSEYSGLNLAVLRLTVFGTSGLMASLAGVLLAGYVGVSYLGMGDPYLFSSVTAVAIGGASILGGRGNYIGTVVGAFTMTILAGVLPVLNLAAWAQDVVFGLALLATIALRPRG